MRPSCIRTLTQTHCFKIGFRPTENSSKLTLTLFKSFVPSETAFHINCAMSRHLLEDGLADALKISKTSLYYRFLLNVIIILVIFSVLMKRVLGDWYLDLYRKRVVSCHLYLFVGLKKLMAFRDRLERNE